MFALDEGKDVQGVKKYANDAERQTARRVRRYAAGLNSQGKPYGRHKNFVTPGETPLFRKSQRRAAQEHVSKRKASRYQRIAEHNRRAGLRVDGKPFRRHPQDRAWQQFQSEIKVEVATWGDIAFGISR